MTQFRSSVTRSYWTGLLIAIVTDFALAFCIAYFFVEDAGSRIVAATVGLIAWYILQAGYALWCTLRYVVVFHMFEKESRIGAIVQKFKEADMMPPSLVYASPEDYLTQAAFHEEASREATVMAGALLGNIEAMQALNHPIQTMFFRVSLEEAIRRYSASTGGTTHIH